jgi:hypothetical protein
MSLDSVSFIAQPKARLIDYLRFYVPLKNISLLWRRQKAKKPLTLIKSVPSMHYVFQCQIRVKV